MAKHFQELQPEHRAFIERQHVFFVASAAPAEARVNLSPKGLDTLRVLDERTLVWLDLTGSGNETAAHIRGRGRITLMFCAFEGPPLVLRLYGRGRVFARGGSQYAVIMKAYFGKEERVGARQVIQLDIDAVQTSCGYAVPHLEFRGERDGLDNWARAKGGPGLAAYRSEHNQLSIDGLPTGFIEPGSDS